MRKPLWSILAIVLLFGCAAKDSTQLTTSPDNPLIRITGRITEGNDSVTLYWSGTSILVRFSGKELKAKLRDERGKNYFNIVVDGETPSYIKIDSIKRSYTLASNLGEGEHTIELIKGTEWDRGKTWFYGMEGEGKLLDLPAKNERVIEFFGNSITAGYAIDDYSGKDSPDNEHTNNYQTYAAITARHFHADLYCTVKSGIGILISWFPLIMPEMYDRLDPSDSLSKWNFKKVTPQVVVINLFQNDSWLIEKPDYFTFRDRFGTKKPDEKTIVEAYGAFISKVRAKYPDAYIICALGSMDATKEGSPWPGYVEKAVEPLHDTRILTHFFPYMNKGGHPRIEDNKVMADDLIAFIEKKISW
jgi:hypothetical protein